MQGVELGSGNVDCRFDAGVTASVNLTVQEVSATSDTSVVTGYFSFSSPGMSTLQGLLYKDLFQGASTGSTLLPVTKPLLAGHLRQ